jgi:SAM-dependent methyltransferase
MPDYNLYPGSAEVAHYEATRYASPDQQLVSRREQELTAGLLRAVEAPRKLVLDAPCGYGRFSRHLAGRGWHFVNLDLAPAMVAHSIEAAPAHTTGVAASLYVELPFRDATFDGALCVRMLHNTIEPARRVAILKALGRVVNDWLLVTYYGDPLLHVAQFRLRRVWSKKARQSMAMIAPAVFAAEAQAAGLRVEKDIAVLPVLHAQRVALLRKR